jgi:uncharacterized Tic20 family protein
MQLVLHPVTHLFKETSVTERLTTYNNMASPLDPQLRKRAMYLHLCGLCTLILPLGGVWVTYLLYSKWKKVNPELQPHAYAVMNFQASLGLYMFIAALLMLLWFGLFILVFLVVVNLLCVYLGTITAHDLEVFNYPARIEFWNEEITGR